MEKSVFLYVNSEWTSDVRVQDRYNKDGSPNLVRKLNPFSYVIVREEGFIMKKKTKVMTKAIIAGSVILTCSLLLMASGCSSESDEAAAIKVGKILKMMQYQVKVVDIETETEDMLKELEAILRIQEAYKPFLTEKGYESFVANRQSAIASQYAQRNKLDMQVQQIQFENMEQDNMEKDTFSFRYSIDIELSPSELTSSRGHSLVTKTGHMTVVKEDNQWKVLKDLDKGFFGDEIMIDE